MYVAKYSVIINNNEILPRKRYCKCSLHVTSKINLLYLMEAGIVKDMSRLKNV